VTDHKESRELSDDVRILHQLGYAQEFARVLGGFSNFAISLTIVNILAGGITSFHVGFCSVGGASIGIAWPVAGLFSLFVAATMGQIASAYPTAGGLYHWAAILGGRGWGWATAWFNLLGLIAMLAAINVGTYQFTLGALAPDAAPAPWVQLAVVSLITASHAYINHVGIRVTRILTDLSGYWIFILAAALTVAFLVAAPSYHFERLWTFTNFSGLPADKPVWPAQSSRVWLFGLGMLLPAYTLTGFDASAHVSEETTGAAVMVPRGIIRSVLVSVLFGWIMLSAAVLAMRDPSAAAARGDQAFVGTMADCLPRWLYLVLCGAISIAQYLCGLATVTSASRMAFAFARDGGLPCSHWLRHVSPQYRTPHNAVWAVSVAAVLFTVYAEAYDTIAAASVVLLYVSYVLPTALGFLAYGRTWITMGPWHLGRWFRPLAVLSVICCIVLSVICMQPPNEKVAYVVLAMSVALVTVWFALARRTFPGPPHGITSKKQELAIAAAEAAVHEGEDVPIDDSQLRV
jgi:amino acid transporter